MASPTSTGLSRVTLVAPRTRVDLALPSDIPLADLLPTLLRYAGDGLADDSAAREGWSLSRLGGTPLDSTRTPAQLDVRDGELLYLRPRGTDVPSLVFDDVVDAVATATQERGGRWQPATTRRFGLSLGLGVLLGAVVAELFAGPPQLAGALVGLGLGVAVLCTGVVLSRALGDAAAGTAFALVGCVHVGAGGLLVAAGDRGLDELSAAHLLIGATAVLLAVALATVGVGSHAPVFLCAGIGAVALGAGAAICLLTGAGAAGAAAVVGTVSFATLPALPMLAYRLARLPIPSVPSDPEDLKQDTETVDGARVLTMADRADAFLAALLGALAAIGAGSALLCAAGGPPGIALSTVLGLLLMSRARWFLGQVQRLPLLVAGVGALGAAGVAVFVSADQLVRLTAVLGGLVGVGAVSVGYALARPGRRASPVWGRTLDLLEVVGVLALIPLAAWVTGLYGWIRTIRG